jgi:hypothetical protein
MGLRYTTLAQSSTVFEALQPEVAASRLTPHRSTVAIRLMMEFFIIGFRLKFKGSAGSRFTG